VIVIGGVLVFRLHPFVILIVAAFAVAILTPTAADAPSAGQRVAEGFGKTALDIGIVIAMASILGTCLSAAGGARRIVESIQEVVGERRTPLALLLSGFVLGIPMFAETVFYLLVPLARAIWERSGRGYLLGVLSIVAGATMTHSLVPPTPGPLFVADALGVDMATMILAGLVVGRGHPAACPRSGPPSCRSCCRSCSSASNPPPVQHRACSRPASPPWSGSRGRRISPSRSRP
jgi:GntP family gluconate:H+ symporter